MYLDGGCDNLACDELCSQKIRRQGEANVLAFYSLLSHQLFTICDQIEFNDSLLYAIKRFKLILG